MPEGAVLVRSVAVIALCATAAVVDLKTRRIPNVLTFGAAIIALVVNGIIGGVQGAGLSIVGWLVGAAIFFPFFVHTGKGPTKVLT